MGHQGKYRSANLRMLRYGVRYNFDPNAVAPDPFIYEVGDPDGGLETWGEGTVLFHNPSALHPLRPGWFGAGVEEQYEGGRMVGTLSAPFQPFVSITANFDASVPVEKLNEHAVAALKLLTGSLAGHP